MTDTDILKRYGLVTLAAVIALAVITWLLAKYANSGIGTGTSIVTAILPALDAGQTFARKTGTALSKQRMWRIAFVGTLINLGISGWLLTIAAAIAGVSVGAVVTVMGPVQVAVVTLIILIVYTLAARFFLGMGQRGELKRQANSE